MDSTATFNFPNGIPGFEEYKRFRLIKDSDSALAQLISVENEQIGFIIVPPEVFFAEYAFELDQESKSVLGLATGKQDMAIEVWVIITNHRSIKDITLNLRAPILLNHCDMLGVQQVINDEKYLFRQPLPLESAKEGNGE